MVYVCIKRLKQKEYVLFMAYLFLNRNMFSKIITLFILLCFIANTILNKKLKERCYLPSGCEFGPQSKDENTIIRINCYDPLVKYDFSIFNRSNEMCRLKQPNRKRIIMSIRANRKNCILDYFLLLLVELTVGAGENGRFCGGEGRETGSGSGGGGGGGGGVEVCSSSASLSPLSLFDIDPLSLIFYTKIN